MDNDQFGAVVPPVYRTSTFAAPTAQLLEQRFRVLLGLEQPPAEGFSPFIYSRFGTPNSVSVCQALVKLERGAGFASVFPSGMSAIFTTIMALVNPGDVVLYTNPVYGCTDDFFRTILKKFGIMAVPVDTSDMAEVEGAIQEHQMKLRVVFLETPSNPIIRHSPIRAIADLAASYPGCNGNPLVVVDNTFLGPVFQSPFLHGADAVVYSATKFLGGHSDLLGGVALTRDEALMREILSLQYTSGPVFSADACALLERSIETVSLRMGQEAKVASDIAMILQRHPRVTRVMHPSLLAAEDGEQWDVYCAQCTGVGSMIAFLVDGGKEEAYRFIDALQVFRKAVSLGGTHSLAIVPAFTTHLSVPDEIKAQSGVLPNLARLSIGTEDSDALIRDVKQALDSI